MKTCGSIHRMAKEIKEEKISIDEAGEQLRNEFKGLTEPVKTLRECFEASRENFGAQPLLSLIETELCYVIAREVDDTFILFAEIEAALGTFYLQFQRFEEAERYLKQALELSTRLGIREFELGVLSNLGNLYGFTGETDKQEIIIENTLEICRKEGNKSVESHLLTQKGILLRSQNKLDEALETYHQSLELARQTGELQNESNILGNIANILSGSGREEESVTYYRQAIEVGEKAGDLKAAANKWNNLGNALVKLNRGEEAVECYVKAAAATGKIEKWDLCAQYLFMAAETCKSLNLLEQHDDLLDQALIMAEKAGDLTLKGRLLFIKADRFTAEKKYDKAIGIIESAWEILEKNGTPTEKVHTLSTLEGIYKYQNDVGKWEDTIFKLIQISFNSPEPGLILSLAR